MSLNASEYLNEFSTGGTNGGGGGGGVLFDGNYPSATAPDSSCGSQNGVGYGAGEGAGCLLNGNVKLGGSEAPGLVYVEWD